VTLEQARSLEWIETNGLGGFASSTACGMNTRRYHGLLTAATRPPAGRAVLLSKIEEAVIIDGRRFELSVNDYPGAIHPRGDRYLVAFSADPLPSFLYQVAGVEIEKRVFMVHGENTTVVQYELRSLEGAPGNVSLELRPLIAFRDFHSTTHANGAIRGDVRIEAGLAAIRPYDGLPEMHFAFESAEIHITGDWYYRFQYGVERERGLEFEEDLFNPFELRFDVTPRGIASILVPLVVSLERRDAAEAPALRDAEIRRRLALRAPIPFLARAADQFIVNRGPLKTVIAGYHWFGDWGRDTMIALPGLTLATGRYEVARDILLAFARAADQGMLPNRFPDAGETPEYNTVDATLWYFEAVRAYLDATGDEQTVREQLLDLLCDIARWHIRGTRYGIRMDSDCLLHSGAEGVQLTWMDAKIGAWVVTPRAGKPVEIQALWYNALCILTDLAQRFDLPQAASEFGGIAAGAKESFAAQFWNPDTSCLYDVVSASGKDPSIRPNQLFAVSLRHSLIEGAAARSIVEVARRELLTPAGLRSLSPRDPNYRGVYRGGVFERDSSYHQGTVWPWLMGPFLSAYLKVNGSTAQALEQAWNWLDAMLKHFAGTCGAQIPELADGDWPHAAKGCIAQAWSVAEALRVARELEVAGTSRF
jgi:predicted glycogen debranching enzyme